MNDHRLSDPSLQSLEARLASIPPRLSSSEQQKLLYECAYAAGQSAGRRAGSRVIQGWIAAASVLGLICLSLAYRAILPPEPTLAHLSPSHGATEVPQDRSANQLLTRDTDDKRQLYVSTALDRVVDFNWPRPSPSNQTAAVSSATEPEQPVLTSRSHISPDSI